MFLSLIRSRSGNVAAFAALFSVPLIIAVAGVVDYSMTSTKAANMQNALDAAALAISTDYYAGKSKAELTAIGENTFRAGLGLVAADNPSFAYGAAPESDGSVTIRVDGSFSQKGFLGVEFAKPRREARVRISPDHPGCLLALDPLAQAAISIAGSADVDLKKCVMVANSTANGAISRTGDANVAAQCAMTPGTLSGMTLKAKLSCPAARQKLAGPVPDPLAQVEPAGYGSCKTVPGGASKTLSPGTYCGQTFSGSIVLEPGIYVLKGGAITLGGSSTLKGKGVTLVLRENASMVIDGGQTVTLSAPVAGPFAGVAIYQEKGNAQQLKLTGNSASSITGFIYAPSAEVRFTGSSGVGSGDCVRIVANTVSLTGSSHFDMDCGKKLAGRKISATTPILVR